MSRTGDTRAQRRLDVAKLISVVTGHCCRGLLMGLLSLAASGMSHADARTDFSASADWQTYGDTGQEFPRAWLMGHDVQRRALDALVGNPPPPLWVSRWIGEPQSLDSLRGKVVVLEFWATWCVPCVRTLALNRQLRETYGPEGLVFIGIHDGLRGLERLDRLLAEHNVTCSVGVDDGARTVAGWGVSFWPTYVAIDRAGIVRAVGLWPEHVRTVVERLIAEPLPAAD